MDRSRDTRDHLAALRESGGSYRAIATAAGVGPMTVHGIATGRRHPTNSTTAAVLAVTPATLSIDHATAHPSTASHLPRGVCARFPTGSRPFGVTMAVT